MANVSSLPQNIWHWFADHLISPVRHTLLSDLTTTVLHQLKQLGNHCTRLFNRQRLGIWLLAMAGACLLLLWNGMLLLALSLGLVTTLILQRYHTKILTLWQQVPLWLEKSHTPVIVSVGCGVLAFIASYLTLLIWQETNSFGMALFILLQGIGIIAILGFLLRSHLYPNQQQLPTPQLDIWLQDLTAVDPLKRLIAVHHINRYLDTPSIDVVRAEELQEYLQLLLKQEAEPSIQQAIAQGLDHSHQP